MRGVDEMPRSRFLITVPGHGSWSRFLVTAPSRFVSGEWTAWSTSEALPETARFEGGLSPSVQYEFRVRSVNALGAGEPGPASEPLFTIPGLMAPPTYQAFLRAILVTFQARIPVWRVVSRRTFAEVCSRFWSGLGWAPQVPPFSFYAGYRVSFSGYDEDADPPDWFPWKTRVSAVRPVQPVAFLRATGQRLGALHTAGEGPESCLLDLFTCSK